MSKRTATICGYNLTEGDLVEIDFDKIDKDHSRNSQCQFKMCEKQPSSSITKRWVMREKVALPEGRIVATFLGTFVGVGVQRISPDDMEKLKASAASDYERFDSYEFASNYSLHRTYQDNETRPSSLWKRASAAMRKANLIQDFTHIKKTGTRRWRNSAGAAHYESTFVTFLVNGNIRIVNEEYITGSFLHPFVASGNTLFIDDESSFFINENGVDAGDVILQFARNALDEIDPQKVPQDILDKTEKRYSVLTMAIGLWSGPKFSEFNIPALALNMFRGISSMQFTADMWEATQWRVMTRRPLWWNPEKKEVA